MPPRANQATGAGENWQWKTTGSVEDRGTVRLTQPLHGQPAVGLEYVPSSAQLEIQGLMGIFKCQQILDFKKKKKELEESEEIVWYKQSKF